MSPVIPNQFLNINYISREIEIMSELKSERVVQYMKTKIDVNNTLYIQMEFCSDNLKNILDNKHSAFRRDNYDQMNELEYYISYKIFIDLIEALNYLQEQTPPIIHRDIKPANILFTETGTETGIFFKLCDFGLAKLYEQESNSIVGTKPYIAEEVWSGKYDTKADVFSLSVIGNEIFQLNNNSMRNDKLSEHFEKIEDLLEKMSKKIHRKRPNCKEIIEEVNSWCLPLVDLNKNLYDENYHSLSVFIKYHLHKFSL